jgi:hypothetical protein
LGSVEEGARALRVKSICVSMVRSSKAQIASSARLPLLKTLTNTDRDADRAVLSANG